MSNDNDDDLEIDTTHSQLTRTIAWITIVALVLLGGGATLIALLWN